LYGPAIRLDPQIASFDGRSLQLTAIPPMRIIVACVILLLVPPLALIGWKQYQQGLAVPTPTDVPVSERSPRGEVLFFNASWCGPCRQMRPIVSQLRRHGFHMRDIDVDKNKKLANQYNIHAVPTFVFVENGTEVKRFSGGTSADSLREMCASSAYH
jgi:thiol-disulfide isomerase/thioredoxin